MWYKKTSKVILSAKISPKLVILIFVTLFSMLGTYLIFNGMAATTDQTANIWVASNGNDSGLNCKLFTTSVQNPDTTGATLCKSFSAALGKASAGTTTSNLAIRVLAGSYGSQSASQTGITRDASFDNNIEIIANDGPGSVTLSGLNVGSSSAGSYGGVNFDGFKITGGPTIQEAKDVKFSRMEANNQTYISNSQNIELNDYKVQPNGWPGVSSMPFSNGWGIGIVQQGSGSVSAPSNITLDKVIIRGVRATQAADHPDGVFMWRGGGVSSAAQWTGFTVKNSLFYNNECINWRYNDANPVQVVFENNFFDSSVNGISGCGYYSISVASETGTYKNNTIRGGVQVKEGDCAANCGAVRTWKNNVILGGWSDQGCSNLSNDTWSKNILDSGKCGATDITASAAAIKFAGGSTYPDMFFLTAGSVAIDAGDATNGSYPATDYLGISRPQGSAPDIGAYEHPSGSSQGQKANLWVDPNGGGCSRQDTAGAYDDAGACGRFQDAWSICQPGDTIIVKSSATNYGAQSTSGSKASTGCTIKAEAPDTVTVSSLNTNGGYLTIKDITVDVGLTGRGGWSTGSNVTAINLKIHGGEPNASIQGVTNVTWDGGELGQSNGGAKPRDFCNGSDEPVTIASSSAIKVKHVTFWPQTTITNPDCDHMENFRIDGTSATPTNDILLEGNFFKPGDGSNTSRIFITATSSSWQPTNIKIQNNYFGGQATAYDIDVHNFVTSCSTFTIAYNTLLGGDNAIQCSDFAGMQWIGNAGGKAGSACRGIFTKNVWVNSASTACGSGTTADKWVSGNAYSAASALGVNASGDISSTSPANDAGELTYCTSSNGINSLDRYSKTRPVGTLCDAGSMEYGAGGTTTPPTCSGKQGDTNNDNAVNIQDISLILGAYGQTNTTSCIDVTKDGSINIQDISLVLSKYGT